MEIFGRYPSYVKMGTPTAPEALSEAQSWAVVYWEYNRDVCLLPHPFWSLGKPHRKGIKCDGTCLQSQHWGVEAGV